MLIRDIPDFLALSSFKFLFFSFFLCYSNRKNQKTGFFSSVSAVLRGHPIENSLCNLTAERKNNEQSSPRRFYSDGGCGRRRHELVCGSQIRRIIMQCELPCSCGRGAESPDSLPPPRASVQIGLIPHREAQPLRFIDWAAVQVFGLCLLH